MKNSVTPVAFYVFILACYMFLAVSQHCLEVNDLCVCIEIPIYTYWYTTTFADNSKLQFDHSSHFYLFLIFI